MASNARLESARPSIATSDELAGRQAPSISTQASPGAYTTGSPSTVPNVNLRNAITPDIGKIGAVGKGTVGEHGEGEPGNWGGFNLTTEVRAGQFRRSTAPDGSSYETKYAADYGFFNDVPVGKDGEPPDFYMGTNPDSPVVYVLDELSQKTGKFKQTKSLLGFDSENDALKAYLGTSTKSLKSVGAITPIPVEEFKRLLQSGELAGPVAKEAPISAASPARQPHRVTTANGTTVDVAPKVMEADKIIASSDFGYEKSLQPRQRSRAASQAQVRDIASNLDPERLGYSAEADRGAPIVGPDGMVESGNGRVLALRNVYEQNGPQARAYRDWLAKQGVDVTAYKNPVLVRQRITPMSPQERQAFAVDANRASTLAMSATERARSDANLIDEKSLNLLVNPNDIGANRDFVRRFVRELPQAEQGALMDASGALSAEGATRIRNAVFAKAYGDVGVLARLAESTNDEIRSISNALAAVAPKWARLRGDVAAGRVRADMDVTPDLMEAVKRTAKIRGEGQKLDTYLDQADAFNKIPDIVEGFMRMFYDPQGRRALGGKRISDALGFYAEEARKAVTDKGLDLGLVPVEPRDIQKIAREKGWENYGEEVSDRGGAGYGEGRPEGGNEIRRPGAGEGRPGVEQEGGGGGQAPGAGGEGLAALERKVIERDIRGRPIRTEPIPVGTENQILQAGFERSRGPQFYSAVERAITGAKQDKASPEQWAGMLKNMPGVKPEEMEWLGLADWLKEQKGSVTKAQIADYVRANQIEVKEVEKGAQDVTAAKSRQAEIRQRLDTIQNEFDRRYNETHGEGRSIHGDPAEYEARRALADEERSLTNEYNQLQGTVDKPTTTKFASYQLPGGSDYREMLLTLPPKTDVSALPAGYRLEKGMLNGKDRYEVYGPGTGRYASGDTPEQAVASFHHQHPSSDTFKSSHFDEPNILAHVRFNDRTIDGKKTLLVEEVQSDLHQKGREVGYKKEINPEQHAKLDAERKKLAAEVVDMPPGANFSGGPHYAEWERRMDRITEINRELGDSEGRVPDLPFKTSWPELAMKRMIRYAAENGYDKIAWTTGETQAARYDLSKQVKSIDYTRNGEQTGLNIYLPSGERIGKVAKSDAELTDIVGKEVADKIIGGHGKTNEAASRSGNAVTQGTLENLDLKMGGEGMKVFYDQILPATVNKLVKKFGARVGKAEVNAAGGKPTDYVDFDTYQKAKTEGVPVHTLDITPSLRGVAFTQGFPQFASGGAVSPCDGNAVPESQSAEEWSQPSVGISQSDKLVEKERAGGGRVDGDKSPMNTRKESHYSPSRGTASRHCGADKDWPIGYCSMYIKSNKCSAVGGFIATKGRCDLWEKG